MANVFSKDRYNDPDGKVVTDKTFYLVMSATLLFGFLVNALEVAFMTEIFLSWNPVVFFIVYAVMAFSGVLINAFSRNPIVSFIGYCLVILPLGALLSIVVPAYSSSTVLSAFIATSLITAAMTLFAAIKPDIFLSLWKVLSLCLFISIIWSVIAMFFMSSSYVILDWFVVVIFSGYIGLDVSFAAKRPKTLDNAVDSACALYLDIINIFVRLLAIFGRNK